MGWERAGRGGCYSSEGPKALTFLVLRGTVALNFGGVAVGEWPFVGDENQRNEDSRRRRAFRTHDEATEHFYTARPILDTPDDNREESPSREAPGGLWAQEAPPRPYAPNEVRESGLEAFSDSLSAYSPNEAPEEEGFEREGFGEQDFQEPVGEEAFQDAEAAPEPAPWASPAASYYCRPSDRGEADSQDAQEMAFAPPPKMSHIFCEEPLEEVPAAAPKRHVYQPREATWAHTARMNALALQGAQYEVEAARDRERARRSRRRRGRRVLAAVCVLAVLGAAAYAGRDWLGQQIALLTGAEPVNAAEQADTGIAASSGKGYDPAPPVKLGVKAQQGIAAVSGTLEMEPVAVTTGNVLTRTPVGEGLYDYYLFAGSDGRLLAYFDELSAADFIPQSSDSFYVSKAPYLLNSQGKALIRPAAYQQAAGADAVLGPLENGWALIQDRAGTRFNYINAQGEALSALWFCRALPFWGERTLAYVDTGNLAKPEERYSLYVLSKEGKMDFWRHASDTQEVVGAACDLALLNTGELVRLEDLTTVALVEEAAAYLDCEAVVAKERESGKYALFVGGEQHYDFAYEQIAPVPSEIQWAQSGGGSWVNYAVAGAPYPQPLSHYFRLQRADGEEQVALSTRSCCPVLVR